MVKLYGIKNCDTVRKARRWLDQHAVEYAFADFREEALTPRQVEHWLDELGLEVLLNRRSTSWKALPAQVRESMNPALAVRCILEHPTLIKRPLLDTGSERHVGFSPAQYQRIFGQHTL